MRISGSHEGRHLLGRAWRWYSPSSRRNSQAWNREQHRSHETRKLTVCARSWNQIVCRTIIARNSQCKVSPQFLDGLIPSKFPKPILILLVTPSFAEALDASSELVSDTLQGLFEPVQSGSKLGCDVLSAVVDHVPEKRWAKDRTASIIVGREGVSFLVAPSSSEVVPKLWKNPSRSSSHKYGSISFASSFSAHGKGIISDAIEVPLSNTLFNNGKSFTMSAEHWTRAVESGTWSRHRREELVSKEIQLPGVSGYSEDNTESDSFQMFCPLVPLTIPRRVIRSFGNIVSQLDGGDGDVRPLPASMELEESLDKYTYALGLRPQAMMIWALILPPHVGQRWSFTSKIEDSWVGALADHAQNIKAAIDSGARLHRVLSGGGGWGDKSGLLSVDPEASYSIAKEDNTIHSSLDVEVGGLGKLQEVFTENDYVQFLVAPPTLAEEMTLGYPLFVEDAQPDVDETKGAIPDHYIHLGVSVPFDLTKSIENSIGGKSVKALSRVFAHFGALSEQGMAYRREIQQPDRQDEGETLRTKIDVPHTRASFKV